MSDLLLLKKKIYEDGDVAKLLEELGCEHVHEEQGGRLIVAQLPPKFNSNNRRSVQITNTEKLSANIRSRNITGDIFSIVGYILYPTECKDFDGVRNKLYHIKHWVCNALEYDNFLKENRNSDYGNWNSWLKDIKKKRVRRVNPDDKENEVIPESVMNQYIRIPHMRFIEEGINMRTQEEFEIHFDLQTERIVFPVRNRNGDLIGVKGRYVGRDKRIMDEVKYLYLYPCDKSIELYNLHRALPYIREKGEVIVVEGAKSCWLLWQWGYKNCVSLEGKEMTPAQARLLKDLEVNIVFGWDKDVTIEEIKKHISQIKSRLVDVIIDTQDLLEDHNSPVDRGIDVWHKLYSECRYNKIT